MAFVTKSGCFCVFVKDWFLNLVNRDLLRLCWNCKGVILVRVEYARFVGGLDRKVVKVAMGSKREATCSRLVWK